MTSETTDDTTWWTMGRTAAVIVVAFLVAVGAWMLISQAAQERASDRRTDEYYCAQAGIGPLDRAPETGELCADLTNY